MKISTILFLLALSGAANGSLRGSDDNERALKKSKKKGAQAGKRSGSNRVSNMINAPGIPLGTVWPGQGVGVQDGGLANRIPGTAMDGDCCNGEAQAQPPSGLDSAGNRVGGCAVPASGFKPTFHIDKKGGGGNSLALNRYITGVPRSMECECNDQCGVQDGNNMVCCLKSHYFIADDNKNIKLCCDLSGITEAAMNGCVVTPEEEPLMLSPDALDIGSMINPSTGKGLTPLELAQSGAGVVPGK